MSRLNWILLSLVVIYSATAQDNVLLWNEIALQAVANDHTPSMVDTADQGGPTRTTRALAIVHAAIFDAINMIDASYTPYLSPPDAAYSGASIDAAIAQAAYDTLVDLYPKQKETFDRELEASLAKVPDGESKTQGIEVGSLAAATILQARVDDGSNVEGTYEPTEQPGDHRADPLHPNQGYLTPAWGEVKPFTLTQEASDSLRLPPPPALDSEEYAVNFDQVKTLGGDGTITPTTRTAEQTDIGYFWGYDGIPFLGPPMRLYNQVTRELSMKNNLTVVENARLFALVNLALADAGIRGWNDKYYYRLWRPVLGIREADEGTGPSGLGDGNPDTVGDETWTPLGVTIENYSPDLGPHATPNFPAYPSGHGTFSGALFGMLENYFGTDEISFDVTSEGLSEPETRSFTSLSDAATESANSRVYLGVHWPFDGDQGLVLGNEVSDYVFENYLQPVEIF